MNTANTTHKFERAGLGIAPFRVSHYTKSVYQACQGAPVQVGTSCDYCGTGIMHVYWIRSADGRIFKVGSDCVAKTGDAGLGLSVRAQERSIRAEARQAKRAAAHAECRTRQIKEAAIRAYAHIRAHEGLVTALNGDHYITRDIRARFVRWGALSDAQTTLVFKLAARKVGAPEGRQVVTGEVKSIKERFSQYGATLKMMVMVTTPEGVWHTWGTVPRAINPHNGDVVTFTATVKRALDDPTFSFFSRPAKASVAS